MSKVKVDAIESVNASDAVEHVNPLKIKETSAPSAPSNGHGILYVDSSDDKLKYKHTSLTPSGGSSGDPFDLTLSNTSGETNTASNVASGSGTEYGVWKEKNGVDLRFKSLKQGSNITLTSNTNDITISSTAGGTDLGQSTAVNSLTITSSTGNNVTIAEASGSIAGLMTTAHHNKLDAIEASADVTPTWVPSSDPNYLTSVATSNIDNDAVTYAKMQNMTTDRLLGRTTASTGVVEELDKNAVLGLLNVSDGADVTGSNTCNSPHVATDLSKTTSTTQLTIKSSTGADVVLEQASGTIAGLMTTTHHNKHDGIASGATANDTDANLKARGNHTGTQSASTISDFDTQVATTAVLKGTANTMSASINMNNNILDNPILQSYRETIVTANPSSNTITIDLSQGNVFKATVNENVNNFTISNLNTTANIATSFTLMLDIDGTNREVDLLDFTSFNIKWVNATGPEQTHTANTTNFYSFTCLDPDSTTPTWYGFVSAVGIS